MNSIVYTNEKCIGCNKCISVCSAIGACVSTIKDGEPRIEVDGKRCVACGSCMDVCVHDARRYYDDTERFFRDLKKGKKISLLLAPAFKANYPNKYGLVLGGLKKLGVNRIINVAFGADITTWGYLNYIKKYNFLGGISQPCPAVVSYIERYLPELLPKLFPVQSPLMCAATYARKEMGMDDSFAFISPCIAKKMEISDPHNKGLVQYNVTFDHLMKYVKEHNISGPFSDSEIEYGLGSFYPAPGGLSETVKWFLGDDVFIRQIEGERRLYEWLHANESRIKFDEIPFLLIDALNCEKGCICGTAVDPEKAKTDDALYEVLKIRNKSKNRFSGTAWSSPDSLEERLKNFNKQFENLVLEDYIRGYTDRSKECAYTIPNEDEADAIFRSMNKITEESRHIDCTCCGYHRCFEMVTAIHNGFNRKENCIHYEKDMVQKLEVKSSTDLLTGLLNKISFEEEAKKYLAEREEYDKCAVFIFDFDNFKLVNDNFGHKAGDEVLKRFGEILKKSFRDDDIIGRIGGDEFMVIFVGEITEAGLAARCDKINSVLKGLEYADVTGLSCSIGVVIDNDRISQFDELYQLADDALYEAKARGKAQFIKWHVKPIEKPSKDLAVIVSNNKEFIKAIKKKYGKEYEYYEVSSANTVLNEISLYRDYVKRVFFDFSMEDITEEVIMEYIKSRPMFASVSVNDY